MVSKAAKRRRARRKGHVPKPLPVITTDVAEAALLEIPNTMESIFCAGKDTSPDNVIAELRKISDRLLEIVRMVHIEKDLPLPPHRIVHNGTNHEFPYHSMSVGDSFVVMESRLKAASGNAYRRNFRVVTRAIEDKPGFHRVWLSGFRNDNN